ncbi:Alpha/Beta hydrolase protein [Polychytrium aggregatum]|uniref:Alpha/Beta hydrolase protein n=1 Tax=Polychytrium aggregatum TaxID=110093 RepID=UPI0022FDEF99|nr:Alpha/Beta hydrolase protein [Polychytrium aggregatum]XP_052971213.1 Alpha/Beta hydrolase protein [Polychytrium aggregatum]KAI9188627.1 Alpha/Beta hydrolase protein [Polychytrium aggregatum]KAI9209133.1 Alpha/Beta hydrolase protein [Polychytrium aggregatum]
MAVTELKNLAYGPLPRQSLDLYLPASAESAPNTIVRPWLVYIHGGAWRGGNKSQFEFLGRFFASRNIPTACVTYRLSVKNDPESPRHPVHVEDCAKAIAWLSQPNAAFAAFAPPTKLYLCGHSAGGQITGLLHLDPHFLESLGGKALWSSVKGIIGVEGIYDIPALIARWPSYIDFIDMAFTSDVEVWKKGSPQFYTLPSEGYPLTKYLVIHSTDDELVDLDQSIDYHRHLQRMDPDAQLDTSLTGTHDDMLKTDLFLERVHRFIIESEAQ